ncbi:TPA: hypothetical protein L4936_001689 [Pseudomonas aeruginosa]|nr:hypothetical protein [Pseudomonas aeruginosa]HBO7218742.1 hypothetical protein [Pseudomonas aeruginosa]
MKRLYEEQEIQARLFADANKDLIDRATEMATHHAESFMRRVASRVLPAQDFLKLSEKLSAGDIFGFNISLRQIAVPFVKNRVSGCYWMLFDAITSLYDSTHGNWPYMTDAGRMVRVTDALEYFGVLELVINQELDSLNESVVLQA